MLTENTVRRLLEPFGIELTSRQIGQLLTYLEILLLWNRKINLTGVREPEACVTRHFGESLYLARWFDLKGELLDIGSGAGFPGLALKIVFPEISATLLEPVAKKRAFLKEVSRTCGMESVEIRPERLEDFVHQILSPSFDSATSRAVGHLDTLVPLAMRGLKPGGRLFLWLTHPQGQKLEKVSEEIDWTTPIPLPLARTREIWAGTRRGLIFTPQTI